MLCYPNNGIHAYTRARLYTSNTITLTSTKPHCTMSLIYGWSMHHIPTSNLIPPQYCLTVEAVLCPHRTTPRRLVDSASSHPTVLLTPLLSCTPSLLTTPLPTPPPEGLKLVTPVGVAAEGRRGSGHRAGRHLSKLKRLAKVV